MEARWKLHCKHAFVDNKTTKFCNTLRKHGKDNFEVQVLIDNITDSVTLNEMEIQQISEYNSTNPNIGYNISLGGTGGFTQEMRDKSIATRRERGISPTHLLALLAGRQLAGYRKKTNKEKQWLSTKLKQYYIDHPDHHQHISELNKNKAKSGEEHHMWGKKHSIEARTKISAARQGKSYEYIFGDKKATQLKADKQKLTGNKNPNYSNIDQQLLELLCNDPRLTRKKLGVLLSCSGPTITKRIRTLIGIKDLQHYRRTHTDIELTLLFETKLHEFIYNTTR